MFSYKSELQTKLGCARKIYTIKNQLSENYYGYKGFNKGIDNTMIYVESKDRKDILTLCINGNSKENL